MKTRIKVKESNEGVYYQAQFKRSWWGDWCSFWPYYDFPYSLEKLAKEGTLERAKAEIDYMLEQERKNQEYKSSKKVSYIDYP